MTRFAKTAAVFSGVLAATTQAHAETILASVTVCREGKDLNNVISSVVNDTDRRLCFYKGKSGGGQGWIALNGQQSWDLMRYPGWKDAIRSIPPGNLSSNPDRNCD